MSFFEDFVIALRFTLGLVVFGVGVLTPIALAVIVSPWFFLCIFVTLPLGFAISEIITGW